SHCRTRTTATLAVHRKPKRWHRQCWIGCSATVPAGRRASGRSTRWINSARCRILKRTLFLRQKGYCMGACELQFAYEDLTLDHIVPRSQGGTNHINNFWLMCQECNRSKGDTV